MSILIFILELALVLMGCSFWVILGICMFREKEAITSGLKLAILLTGVVAFGIFVLGVVAVAFLK